LFEHKNKIFSLSGYSEDELDILFRLLTEKIRFIKVELIPPKIYSYALSLTQDIDIDDIEFVALTEHIKGRFWSGDKELKTGLIKKGWTRFISADELFEKL
jgi:predicted nucleic acid-binding protein